jgi:hypothetical protein
MHRKLTDGDVLEIRRLHALGNTTHRAIAGLYDVSTPTITDIVNMKRRKYASPAASVVEHAGETWYRRGGQYWYKQPTGSGTAHVLRTCVTCGSEFFARRSRILTQGLHCSIRCSRAGERNPAWRGLQVGYRGAHKRVELERGKASFCNILDCDTGSTTYHWANLTGEYADVWDYESMCVSHHRRYDYARAQYLAGLAETDTASSF